MFQVNIGCMQNLTDHLSAYFPAGIGSHNFPVKDSGQSFITKGNHFRTLFLKLIIREGSQPMYILSKSIHRPAFY